MADDSLPKACHCFFSWKTWNYISGYDNFFCMFLLAVSSIVSWKVSLVFLLNLAEWDESLHIVIVPLFAVSLLHRTMQWDGILWTSVSFRRHCNCLIDDGISVTVLSVHLLSLLSFLPFLIFSCVI